MTCERSHDAHNRTSSSRPDCHQERLDADDVHYACEVERIYIGRRFRNDTERLEKLFDLYTKMTAGQGAIKKRKAEVSA
jgi:hypothetical protein